MIKWLRQTASRIITARRLRTVLRSRQLRWLSGLSIVMLCLIIAIISVEIRVNENLNSLVDIFYWAVVTISTVGYGDIAPQTTTGYILTPLMIMLGVVLVSFMTATIASILTATRIREGMGLKKIEIDSHIVLCGFNSNIENILRGIVSVSPERKSDIILVNTNDEAEINDLIEHFPEIPISFVHGDYIHESTLNRASITKASSAIILADSGPDGTAKPDDRTLLTVLAIKSMAQDTRLCVQLLETSNEVHLRRAGVDQIVVSGEFSGFMLANAVMAPGIPQALKEVMNVGLGSDIQRVEMPPELIGKTFAEAAISLYQSFDRILIGVITENESFSLDTMLTGEKGAIDDFIRRKFDEAGRSLEVETKGLVSVNLNPGKDYVISEWDYAIVITSKQEIVKS